MPTASLQEGNISPAPTGVLGKIKTTEREGLVNFDVTKVIHDVSETGSNHNVMNNCKKKNFLENFKTKFKKQGWVLYRTLFDISF